MKPSLLFLIMLCSYKAFPQEPSAPEILQQADQLIREYKFEQALSIMNHTDDSLNNFVLQRKGLCFSKLGNYSDAIKTYERLRNADSLNREALYNLGQLYSLREEYELSGSCFQKLIAMDSTNSYYYKQYAAVAQRKNDPISAIAYYIQTVNLNPRDIEAYSHLSSILLDAEQYLYVDSMLTKVLSIAENSQLRLLLARAKLGQDKYREVIANIETILLKSDTTATYARLLGISYFQLDQYKKVIPCMQFLIGKGVKADWIYYYLGVAFQEQDDIANAIIYLNMAVEESMSDHIGAYYTQLASAYEQVKDFKSAIRSYRTAYETSKADILLYHLARNYDVYYKDKTQAQLYYKKYLESKDTIQLARKYSKHRLDALSDSR